MIHRVRPIAGVLGAVLIIAGIGLVIEAPEGVDALLASFMLILAGLALLGVAFPWRSLR